MTVEERQQDELKAPAGSEPTFAGKTRRGWGPLGYVLSPVGVLVLFFAGPMMILAMYSFQERGRIGTGAWTLENYAKVGQPFYLEIALDTFIIAAIAMFSLL